MSNLHCYIGYEVEHMYFKFDLIVKDSNHYRNIVSRSMIAVYLIIDSR